jgi:acetate CoA/acetoacetate CoA-transferase alpha subunit
MQTVSLEQAVAMIPDGASLMIGGFMAVGTPERVVDEIVRQNKRNLTVIANDTASPGRGIGKLITAKLVHKAIVSHIGLNPETQRQMTAGELEVELVPQGTLIDKPASAPRSRRANSRSRLMEKRICWKSRFAPTLH